MIGTIDERQALGAVLKRLRIAADLTQAALANRCSVHRTYIVHAEKGRQTPDKWFWQTADRALAAEGALVAAFDAYTSTARPVRTISASRFGVGAALPIVDLTAMLDTDLKAWVDMNRREMLTFLALAGTLDAPALLAGLEHDTAQKLARAVTVQVDADAIDQIEAVLDAVGRQYETFGPRAVLQIRRNQADLVDALMKQCPDALKPRLLSVRASLERSLGWMCYDAGDLAMANHHYEIARDAAHHAANPALSALVLCNMSIAATRDDKPGRGVEHAMAAQYWATRTDDQYLLAYARDMAAEAHAQLGEARECRTALDEARDIIDAAAATALPSYVYDPGLNAGFAAECLIKLGIGDQAVTAAKRCVELINPAYALSLGFANVGLGTALCLTGEIDEAATIINHTAHTAISHGSARLAQEVRAARDTLTAAAPGSTVLRVLDTTLADNGL